MPLIDPLSAILTEAGTTPKPEVPPQIGALDVLAAAERQFNPVTSLYEMGVNEQWLHKTSPGRGAVASDMAPVAGYNPADDLAGYEDYATQILRSESPQETQLIKQRIRTERADKQVLAQAGGWGMAASFAAGLTDPLVIASMGIPVAPALANANRIEKIGAGVIAQMAFDTAEEVYMHQTQELRTVQDSALNIGAGALLTGLLGTIATRVPKGEFDKVKAAMEAENAPSAPTLASSAADFRDKYVIHYDLRDNPDSRIASMRTGVQHGYAVEDAITDPNFSLPLDPRFPPTGMEGKPLPMDAPARGWAQQWGANRKGAIAYVFRKDALQPSTDGIANVALTEGSKPIAVVRIQKDGQSVWEAMHDGGTVLAVNPSPVGQDSFGAARVVETTLEDEGIAKGGQTIAATMGKISPVLRVLQSPAKSARVLTQKLADIPVRLGKNLKGIANPQSVEGVIKKFVHASRWQATKVLDGAFAEYAQGGGKLTRKEFSAEISRAARSGDTSDIPQAAIVSRWWRKQANEHRKMLQEMGVEMTDDVLGAPSYLPRVYDFDAIIANRYQFEQMLFNWYKRNPKVPKEGAVDPHRLFTEALPGESRAATNQRLAEKDALGAVKDLESQMVQTQNARWEAKATKQQAGRAARDASTEQRQANRLSSRLRVTLRKVKDLAANAPKATTEELRQRMSDALRMAKDHRAEVRQAASARKVAVTADRVARKKLARASQQVKRVQVALAEAEDSAKAAVQARLTKAVARAEKAKESVTETGRRLNQAEVSETSARAVLDNTEELLYSAKTDLRTGEAGVSTAELLDKQRARLEAKLNFMSASAAEKKAAAEGLKDVASRTVKELKQELKVLEDLRTKATEANRLARKAVPGELTDAEIQDEVAKTVEHILGLPSTASEVYVRSKPGAMKPRVLDVPDSILAPYLVDDFETILSGYYRGIAPEIMFRKMGFSSPELVQELEQVNEEFRVLKAQAGADNAKIQKIEKQHTAAIDDLKLLRDRLTNNVGLRGGQHRNWVRKVIKAGQYVRTYNFLRSLGLMTWSSIPDVGNLVRRYGMPRTISQTAKFLTDWEFNKLARNTAHKMDTALEMVLNARTQQIADIMDELPRTRLEQMSQKLTNNFSKITLMSPWNATLKALGTLLEQDAILRAVKNYDKLSGIDKATLTASGIDQTMLGRIGRMIEQHGSEEGGLFMARAELWADQEAAQIVENHIFKMVDELIVTRGVGDLPGMMDSELAKTMLQFKSFAMSSVSRTLIPIAQGLAHGDAKAAQGLLSVMTLGMLSYYTKEKLSGRTPDLSHERLFTEAVFNSGATGILGDIWNPIASFGPKDEKGDPILPRANRFRNSSPKDFLLGPTFGTTADLWWGTLSASLNAGLTDAKIKQKDIHKMRQMIIYQNTWGLIRLLNAMEGEVGEAFGVPGSNTRTFMERLIQETPSK